MPAPIIVGTIIGGFLQALGSFVGRVLVSLGIGYAAFAGMDTSIQWAKDFAVAKITALPPNAVAVAATLQVGTCISILTSALIVRLVMRGMTGGSLKSFVLK